MYSTICLLIFTAFYLFYNTSQKRKNEPKPQWAKALAARRSLSRSGSILLLIAAWIIVANLQGLGAGTFAFGTYLMAMASLIVLINPFRYLQWKHVLGIFVCCLFFECLIF